MDSLANYCSDGENSNNSGDAQMSNEKKCSTREKKSSDVNYDPVQMDMSEESNNNNSSDDSESDNRTRSPTILNHQTSSAVKSDSTRSHRSPSDQRRADHDSYKSSSQGDLKRSNNKNYRTRSSEERCHRSSSDRKHRDSDYKDSKKSRDDNRRRHHDEDRKRILYRRSKYRDRDQRHSRSDRTKDRYRDEHSSYQKDKDRPRSRSKSKDRSSLPSRSLNYREEKGRSKLAQLEKLGIELKTPECTASNPNAHNEQSFYNPLTTATQGKYAEQIQKRKLLWANKSKQEEGKATPAVSSNTWMGTTFTHDQDGKLSAKFKRLMGIKNEVLIAPTPGQKPEILKKQEEMFNNMEQQYEVARATTHTQRGVGLGYASSGYQFPR
ncbi:Similar to rsrc2: Arginine/serine-rich coiled-coil protein 2 (Xenopus laevis) [Cotesia congregata]|uniref:Similar to rsrc2: Arginine/serine-rich coiled-coil protein 2 (Xenopus laevis) n=1 Tax=Cotesia congregata TaxID=51543 RepID=A0A8J2MR89_COTCN|nr:Similar to rsrc2: Arginine/serine-rich coiled-coil protein 2 (Xenopus laevis) [Cotesia congregata]